LRAPEPWPAPAELSEAPDQNDIAFMARKKVLLPSKNRPTAAGDPMRKTILSVLGATLLAASLMQMAVADAYLQHDYADSMVKAFEAWSRELRRIVTGAA
jgi:hypothetical protein